MEKISVIGAGAWGTTLANLIAENNNKVMLWAKERDVVNAINEKHENTFYLKGKTLNNNITASNSLQEVLQDSKFIVTAIPSQFLRSVLKEGSSFFPNNKPIIVDVAKGIEFETFKTMSQIIEEEISIDKSVVALSGPNLAQEVSKILPTATVVASKDKKCLKKVIKVFSTPYFKVLPHDDIIGVEICGSLKNIAAIATGVSAGLGHGNNAAASIMTLALLEMSRVGKYFGAKRATCYGLAGVGDLVATCTSELSRNRFVGVQIAKGKTLEEIKAMMHGSIAEGISTAKAVYELSRKKNINLPLTTEIYKLLYENKDLKEAIADLIYYAK